MFDLRPQVSTFLRTWMQTGGHLGDVELMAAHAQSSEITNVLHVLKSAVTPASLNAATAPAFGNLSSAILESIAAQSVVDYLASGDSGAAILPYASGGAALLATIVEGGGVAEAAAKPIQTMTLSAEDMQTSKGVCTVVASDEVLHSARGGETIQGALRNAIARATNSAFADLLLSLSTLAPIASSGSTAAQVLGDMTAAALAIGAGSGSRLVVLTSPASLVTLAFMPSATGPVFLDLTTSGGQISGVAIFACESLAASGSSILFDASRMAIADGGLALSLARHANVQMDDAPSGASAAFSLWQKNATGARAERPFGVAVSGDSSSSPIVEITSAW